MINIAFRCCRTMYRGQKGKGEHDPEAMGAMKLLVDVNLGKKLAYGLSIAGHDVVRVRDVLWGERASDLEIWWKAKSLGRTIVTADGDFIRWFAQFGNVSVLLVRADSWRDASEKIAEGMVYLHGALGSGVSVLVIVNSVDDVRVWTPGLRELLREDGEMRNRWTPIAIETAKATALANHPVANESVPHAAAGK